MDVQPPVCRYVQERFGDERPVRGDDARVRRYGPDAFTDFGAREFRRLDGLDIMLPGAHLEGRWRHFQPAPPGTVRTCQHKRDIMSRLDKRIQRAYDELRRSGEYYFHFALSRPFRLQLRRTQAERR